MQWEKCKLFFFFNRIIQFFGEHALFAGKKELRVSVLHALSQGVDIKMGALLPEHRDRELSPTEGYQDGEGSPTMFR